MSWLLYLPNTIPYSLYHKLPLNKPFCQISSSRSNDNLHNEKCMTSDGHVRFDGLTREMAVPEGVDKTKMGGKRAGVRAGSREK